MTPATLSRRSGARQVAVNGAALLMAYVIPRVFTVVAVVVAARLLGTGEFGVYGAAAALAVLFSVVGSLGMHPLLVREIALRPDRAGSLVSTAHRVKAVSGLVMVSATGVAARVLFPDAPDAQAAALVLGVGWVIQAFSENLSAYFQAVERMGRWTQASALFGFVSAVVGVSLLVTTGSMVAFCLGFPAGWAAAFVWLDLGRPPGARGGEALPSGATWGLVRRTLPYTGAFVALTLYCKVDVLLLRSWQGDVQVGLYTAAYKFVDVFQALVIVAAGAVYPRLARDTSRAEGTPWAGTRSTELMLLAAVPVGLTLHLVADPTVSLLFGTEYAAAGAALGWLGLLLPLLALSLHSGYVLGAAGRILPMAVLYSAALAINVGLNVSLIPARGAEGAALARLGSEVLLALALVATITALGYAAPRLRALLLAGAVAAVGLALPAVPDPTGGWLRGAALLAGAAVLYGSGGATEPGEARALLGVFRGARSGPGMA